MSEETYKRYERAVLASGRLAKGKWSQAADYKDCEIKTAENEDGVFAWQIFRQGEGHVKNSGMKFKSEAEAVADAKKYIDGMKNASAGNPDVALAGDTGTIEKINYKGEVIAVTALKPNGTIIHYKTDWHNKLFPTKNEAVAYAKSLIDKEKDDE